MVAYLVAALALTGPIVRFGARDITPPEPLPLGGYTARGGALCELPGDRLEARALIFESPESRPIAVVSADLLTIPESLYAEVRKRVGDDVGLFLAATHTHCAPDSQMLNDRMDFSIPGIARFDRKWLDWYAERIAQAVGKARGGAPERFDGMRVSFARPALNRGRRAFARGDTLAVRVRDTANDRLITHYAAHAVLYGPAERHPRTDFPGLIRGARGLFLPGAIGDMSPASTGATPSEQVANFAKRFDEGPWREETWPTGPMLMASEPIGLDPVTPNPEFARLNKIPELLAATIVKRFAPASGELTGVRLGKLAIIGVPGEPSAELGRRIRSIGLGLGFRAVLTVSHVNGWIGYILEPEDYDRGGYEASLGFHGRQTGERIVAAARRLLEKVSGRAEMKVSKGASSAFRPTADKGSRKAR